MNIDKIKKLRTITSLGISECKKALTQASGDFDQAFEILKKKGIGIIEKKKSRVTSQGLIESYIHFGGNLGSLVEINCETDFVARTDAFRQFAKDIAMHIAATGPKYVKKDDILEQDLKENDNIDDYAKEYCLLSQAFVKDNKKTIEDYLRQVMSQTGENIVIKRFMRFSLGDNES